MVYYGHVLVTNSFEFDREIKELAKRNADICVRLVVSSDSTQTAYMKLTELSTMIGIDPPEMSEMVSIDGAVQRMITEHWWRRVLRILFAREIEAKAIVENKVNRFCSIYISNKGSR